MVNDSVCPDENRARWPTALRTREIVSTTLICIDKSAEFLENRFSNIHISASLSIAMRFPNAET